MVANRNDRHVSEAELSAFADGQLPRARSAQVAAYLRVNPQDADRVHAYWRQEAELYSVFADSADIPEQPPVPRAGRLPLYTAAAAVLLCAFAAPWLLRGGAPAPQLALQDPKRAAVSTYAGLELKPGAGQFPVEEDAVEYHFSDGGGNSLVLYEAGNRGMPAEYIASPSGAARVEWTEGGSHFVLEGARDAAELMSLAVSLRRQLSSPAAAAQDILAGPPESGAGLQSIQEGALPAGVNKM